MFKYKLLYWLRLLRGLFQYEIIFSNCNQFYYVDLGNANIWLSTELVHDKDDYAVNCGIDRYRLGYPFVFWDIRSGEHEWVSGKDERVKDYKFVMRRNI